MQNWELSLLLPTPDYHDPKIIELEQARLLNQASKGSAIMVMLIIFNAAFLMMVAGQWLIAAAWLCISTSLVIGTRLYAHFRMAGVISVETARDYITGHIILTAITGLTWSLFAILTIDLHSIASLVIAATFLVAISMGGLLPGSPHRLDYLVMATCTLLPFPLWMIVNADSPMRYFGFGYIIFYFICVFASSKVHAQTIATINAKLDKARHDGQSTLIVSVGHDLAQPLYAQRNYIEVLARSTTDENQKEIIGKMVEAQSSQEYLLNTLMKYETLERGSASVVLEKLDITNIVASTIEEFKHISDEKQITTTVDLVPLIGTTDGEIVKSCLRNLLSNAYKYTPYGRNVEVKLEQDKESAVLSVIDTGHGIAPVDHETAFAPFRRLDNAAQTQGLGLGLTSVQKYMALLEGETQLESDRGKGTRIDLKFPI